MRSLRGGRAAPAAEARSGGRRRRGTRRAGSARRARRGSSAGRSASAGSPGARGRTGPSRRRRPQRSCEELEVAAARRAAWSGARRSRRSAGAPIRHGIVLPQASSAAKRVRRRARSTTQARSSATITEPEPTWAPTARRSSKVYGVSSALGGRMPPVGPPTTTALSDAARAGLPPSATMASSGVPSGTSATPLAPVPRTSTRIVPGASPDPIAWKAFALLRRIQGTAARVCTFWTTVGAFRKPRVAGCGGRCSGWPRLPSRAFSRTVSSPSMYAPWTGRTSISIRRPLPSASSPMKLRAVARIDRPPRAARSRSVAVERDGDVAGLRADRERRDRDALDHGVRVRLEQRPVGARRRVRAVAVRDDVPARAPRVAGGGPPLRPP